VNLERGITLAFVVGFLILAAVSTTSYLAITEFRDVAELRRRSGAVLVNLQDVLIRISDVESSARGFVLTEDQQYLESYDAAVASIDRELADVSELLAGNPKHLGQITELRSRISKRIESLASTIAVRRAAGLEAAAEKVKTGSGRHLMNDVTRAIDELESEERARYANRNAAVQKNASRAVVIIVVASLLGLGLVTVATLVIRSELKARHRAEETSRRLASIVSSSDDAILGKTLDGVITSWNRGAERLYGYTAEEIVGRPISLLVPPERADEFRQILDAIRCGERVEHFETVRRQKDGSFRDVSVTISPIENSAGHVIGASSIARDISDRKAVERLRTDFLAMLTHDIKNPLAVIDGYLNMLRDTLSLDHESEELLQRIESSTETIISLVSNYLDISKIEAGQVSLSKQTVAVASVLRRVVEQLQTAASHRGVMIALQVDDDLPTLDADPLALERVFANLVGNALKFSPDGGTVTVTAESRSQEVIVHVADNGPGMAPHEIPSLFERYRQTEAGRLKRGAGMGLFIVKSFVTAHGGTVQAQSSPGQGASFEVRLPAEGTSFSATSAPTAEC
jgi:PAS domain S-box-containing protein